MLKHKKYEYERTMNIILETFGINNPERVDMPFKTNQLNKGS